MGDGQATAVAPAKISVPLIGEAIGNVVETAYEDGITLSYAYFTERQFKISLELLEKIMERPVQLTYRQVIDHSILDEINRPGTNRPN